MKHEDVDAFIRSLAYKETREAPAHGEVQLDLTHLRYAASLAWPWPREFRYHDEYLGRVPAHTAVQVLQTIGAARKEHVLNLFDPEPRRAAQVMASHGYRLAWISPLLGKNLLAATVPGGKCVAPVVEADTPAGLRAFNSLTGLSHSIREPDSRIHNFYVGGESVVIAKGQLVYLGGGIAYVSDMFTREEQRRQGHCTSMMAALESKALSLGARRIVLAPGWDAAEIGLYERYGYAESAQRAVLILAQAPS